MSGGKGNSKANTQATTTTTTNQSTINTVDNRAIQGDNAIVGGNITLNTGDSAQVDLTMTDLGAVRGGLDLALESLRGIQSATSGANAAVMSVASDSIGQAYGLANEARQSETSGAINNLAKYLFWIALAGVVVYGFKNLKK
jgi:hypothetical protein